MRNENKLSAHGHQDRLLQIIDGKKLRVWANRDAQAAVYMSWGGWTGASHLKNWLLGEYVSFFGIIDRNFFLFGVGTDSLVSMLKFTRLESKFSDPLKPTRQGIRSISSQVGAELTLQLGRPTPEVKSLAQLKPPFGQKPPSRQNSIFFLLRSSTDLSFIKSVNGYGPNKTSSLEFIWKCRWEAQEGLWTLRATSSALQCTKDACGGLLRVASPPDEELYGSVSFWAEDPSDLKMWSWLATNFRVQWLCECEMSVDDLPEFRHGIRNSIVFDHGPKDGDCLGDFRGEVKKDEEGWEACWKVANAFAEKSHPAHMGRRWRDRQTPSPSTQAYDEHVARPYGCRLL